MRICLFSTTFFPKIGGAEFAIHYIAKYLTESGHKVTVLVPKYRRVKEEVECNYNIHRYQLLPKLLFLEPTLVAHLLLEKRISQFDVLHCHLAYPSGYCGIKFRKIFKVPVVVTLQGADIQKMPEINYGIRLNPKIDKKVKFTLEKVDAITAISSSVRKEIIKASGNEEKIHDIPNGVETWRFNKPVENIRQMFNLSAHTKIILSVGRNHPKKGYPYLLRALPEVLSRYPDTKCIIVGKGTENLRPLIEELGMGDAVILPGSIPKEETGLRSINYPHQDLIAMYLGSDIFVFPSLIEGFALVTVEAMAAGLPIVATNIPGSRDIITDRVNGLLVSPSNPRELSKRIIELLTKDDLRKTLSRNARLTAKQYDWEVLTRKYVEVYENTLRL